MIKESIYLKLFEYKHYLQTIFKHKLSIIFLRIKTNIVRLFIMKLKILGFIFSASIVFASNFPQPATATIDSIENNKAIISQGNLTPGMSGIVIHEYDETHKAIIATAQVQSTSNLISG